MQDALDPARSEHMLVLSEQHPGPRPRKRVVTMSPGNRPKSQLMVTWLVRALAFFMSAKDAVF